MNKGNIDARIGNTPLLDCSALAAGTDCTIAAKMEYKNPMGSIKDRVALYMINEAERTGKLREGGVIVEPTSGNTGIGLAGIARERGYKTIIVMPDSMSEERRMLLRDHGATLVLTPGALGMSGSIKEAERIVAEVPGAFMPSQFENPANPQAHYATTGPEIYSQMQGNVDIFVAGIGTGGTVSGVGRYLKEQNKGIVIVGVEPKESAVLSGGCAGPHGIQGIGAGFVPATLQRGVIDEILPISSSICIDTVRDVYDKLGVLVGISSGANIYAALTLAKREENRGKTIVTVLPDSGERYLSILSR